MLMRKRSLRLSAVLSYGVSTAEFSSLLASSDMLVEELYLDAPLELPDLHLIVAGLLQNRSVTRLAFHERTCREEDLASFLAQFLRAPTSAVKSLDINSIGVTAATMNVIFDALKSNTSLKYLDASRNPYDASDTPLVIGDMLACNSTLEELELNDTTLTDDAGEHIAAVLATRNRTLRHLSLSGAVGERTVIALGEITLPQNTSLTELVLEHVGCTFAGAYALAGGLGQNTSLRQLDLMSNTIGDDGAIAISQAWPINGHGNLHFVCLSDNGVTPRGVRSVRRILKGRVEWRDEGDINIWTRGGGWMSV
jgi:hypothetical protein